MFNKRELLFSFSQQWLTHGYKEITIPATKDGGYRTEKGALHIWPRGEDMLIALPNLDGSFTVTLFAPYANTKYCFDNLTTPEMVQEYFTQEYPDAIALMPNLVTEFFDNPTGPLGTIRCSPWHCYEKVVLLGDAAHAIVPFYGQGMNASFEDVFVFDEILDKHQGDWKTVLSEYEKTRRKDTDAIANLALDNFHEMKEHTASPLFQEKRKLEMTFEGEFPTAYSSKYSLVTFNEDISYHQAMTRGRAQDKTILKLLSEGLLPDSMQTQEKLKLVQQQTNALLQESEAVGKL
jgi:kynurenine 3-monooxygenase